jgi:hypothetical protein
MICKQNRIRLPFLEIVDSAYSRDQEKLFFIDNDRLCSISLDDLKQLKNAARHSIERDLIVLSDECSVFSIATEGPNAAYVDYDESVNLVDLSDPALKSRVEIGNEEDSVSAISISPNGDLVLYLKEMDRSNEPLLVYQWQLLSSETGELSPVAIFGEPEIRMPNLIGWWSPEVACFDTRDSLLFWHIPSNKTKALDILEPYSITEAVFSASTPRACITLEGEDRLVTCLVDRKHNEFALSKLVESHRCLDWGRSSTQILIHSSSGNLRTIDFRSGEITQLCNVENDFDNAAFVADDLILLIGEQSIDFIRR